MNDNKRMQALDDESLDHVSGGVNFFDWLSDKLGAGDPGNTGTQIAPPVPTAAKGCVNHEYLPGSNFCRICGKPK